MALRLPAGGDGQTGGVRASYVLPIRWADDREIEELTDYLRGLPDWIELIIVDGSPDPLFEHHATLWENLGRHLRPDPDLRTTMGKVGGVLTGIREASHEACVIADDDVRYDERTLTRATLLLGLADCVRPQNYFDPLPWHARWDTGRILLNRSLGADFPGTLAVRRSTILGAGGYDGDVIFENLELIRTIRAVGGRVISPLDLYVARRPPSTQQFLSQRKRQAYDDFAIPPRMAAWLAVVPALGLGLARRRWRAPAIAAGALIALAERGRRRAGGRAHFTPDTPAFAPLWVLERGICSWLALRDRLSRGGIPYGDAVVPRAASSMRRLRRRFAAGDARDGQRDGLSRGRTEPDQLVGPVAEGLPARGPAAT
ncbi:MAG TPA: glycosyltransferase family 2 protein [Solirubrobacterales bacterium]|nr:glycosyltransferase family 2 protein [Solirubrobacterales bacterium]